MVIPFRSVTMVLWLLLELELVPIETYQGFGMGYTAVPADIPASDADVVNLLDNLIAIIDWFPSVPVKTLNLNNNLLTTFPNLSNASSTLTILLLEDNSITNIPQDRLQALIMVDTLKLSGNPLNFIPDMNASLGTSLRTLSLSSTAIRKLPEIPVIGSKLIKLFVESCSALEATADMLASFPVLKNLFAAGSGITALPDFSYIQTIGVYKEIDFTNCKISSIQLNKLAHLEYRDWLIKLGNNELTTLPNIWHMDVGAFLDVPNNPLVCDCRMLWVRVLGTPETFLADHMRCEDNRLISSLDIAEMKCNGELYQLYIDNT